jgi:hypothetical protein
MIIRKEQPRLGYDAIKTIEHFAYWPTRMLKFSDDELGEWIWWEKYVDVYKNHSMSHIDWRLTARQRVSVFVLEKFMNENKCEKESYPQSAGMSMPSPTQMQNAGYTASVSQGSITGTIQKSSHSRRIQ